MYAELRMSMTMTRSPNSFPWRLKDVLKAWTTGEAKGVIKRHFSDPEDRFHYKVEFSNLNEQIYGKNGKTKKRWGRYDTGIAGGLDERPGVA